MRTSDRFSQASEQTPHMGQTLSLSLAVKTYNDISGINGLFSSSLVFCNDSRLSICLEELPTYIEPLKAVTVASDEMTGVTDTDRIKLALSKNVPAAAHT